VSRLDLHLVPPHPDLAGGLQFVGASLRAFPLLSFALGAVVAGGVANHVVHQGMHLLDFKYVIAALVVVILILFVAPLTVFTREILQARRRGIFEYGALAGAVGRQMERRWLEPRGKVDQDALDVQHFSATTDLYQVVSNVYQIKSVPLDLQDLVAVIVAVLLPFLPILLFEIPLNVILPDLVKLLL
jgi:FtsH-binding integral membrane protein